MSFVSPELQSWNGLGKFNIVLHQLGMFYSTTMAMLDI